MQYINDWYQSNVFDLQFFACFGFIPCYSIALQLITYNIFLAVNELCNEIQDPKGVFHEFGDDWWQPDIMTNLLLRVLDTFFPSIFSEFWCVSKEFSVVWSVWCILLHLLACCHVLLYSAAILCFRLHFLLHFAAFLKKILEFITRIFIVNSNKFRTDEE